MNRKLSTFRTDNNLYDADQAIRLADARGLRIDCHATEMEGAREGLTVEEAIEVAEEDAGLLTVTYIAPAFGDLWEAPQNIGGAEDRKSVV